MRCAELIKILKAHNCRFLKQGGRHEIWFSPLTQAQFPVPRHAREMRTGTVNDILQQAGIK